MDGNGTPLTDAQLDRELESALGIEPSPEFFARVRTRIASEPEASSWRLAGWGRAMDPLFGVAIVGIVLAIVVPRMFPSTPDGGVARLNPGTPGSHIVPDTTPPVASHTVRPDSPRHARRNVRKTVSAQASAGTRSQRTSTFDNRVLLADSDREAFDRMLVVVSDPTIELIAPVLESTRADGDVIDAVATVPVLAAQGGVNQ